MKMLVTGAAGMIASSFVKEALRFSNQVVTYDRFSYAGRIERLKSVQDDKDLKIMWGDLAAPISEWQADQIGEVDTIVHFAAETMVDQSLQLPYPFIISNYFGTYHLLEYARKLKSLKRMLIISTDEVYGPIELGYFNEKDRLNPTNPYAATKAGADLLANAYRHSYNLPIMIARLSNVYGPSQCAEKMIPTIIRHALNDTEMTVYGDGKHRRCWFYVDDAAEGLYYLLQQGELGEIYHVAADPTRDEVENIQLVQMVEDILNKKIKKKFVPDDTVRRGHDRRYGLQIQKMTDLGWKPQTYLRLGLEKTLAWYQANTCWLSPKGSSSDR